MNASIQEEPIVYLGVSVTPDAIEWEIEGQNHFSLNAPEGHAHFIRELSHRAPVARLVCERADGAELTLVRVLHEAGFAVATVFAAQVCVFAGVSAAAEITPAILTRYAASCPGELCFIEGSRTPRMPVVADYSDVRRLPRKRVALAQRLKAWFAARRTAASRA